MFLAYQAQCRSNASYSVITCREGLHSYMTRYKDITERVEYNGNNNSFTCKYLQWRNIIFQYNVIVFVKEYKSHTILSSTQLRAVKTTVLHFSCVCFACGNDYQVSCEPSGQERISEKCIYVLWFFTSITLKINKKLTKGTCR